MCTSLDRCSHACMFMTWGFLRSHIYANVSVTGTDTRTRNRLQVHMSNTPLVSKASIDVPPFAQETLWIIITVQWNRYSPRTYTHMRRDAHLQCDMACSTVSSSVYQIAYKDSVPGSRTFTVSPSTVGGMPQSVRCLRGNLALLLDPLVIVIQSGTYRLSLDHDEPMTSSPIPQTGCPHQSTPRLLPDLARGYADSLYPTSQVSHL